MVARYLLRFGRWVAVYAAPQELVSKLHLVPAAVAGVLLPAFSGLSASGDRAGLVRRIRQGSRVVALLLTPPIAALILVTRSLLFARYPPASRRCASRR
jgi:O-antigen/teichoic acid export membrane protein